jgi:hypothetical protein
VQLTWQPAKATVSPFMRIVLDPVDLLGRRGTPILLCFAMHPLSQH